MKKRIDTQFIKQFIALLFLLYSAAFLFIKPGYGSEDLKQLEYKLPTTPSKEKAHLLSKLTYLYCKKNPQKAIETGNQALALLKKYPDPILNIDVLIVLGRAYKTLGQLNLSLQCATNAKNIALRTDHPDGLAKAENLIGIYYSLKGNYADSLEHFLEALNIFRETNNKIEIATCLNNIGITYDLTGNYKTALEFYLKALQIKEELGDEQKLTSTLNNIGVLYNLMESYDKALQYFSRALEINRRLNKKNSIAISMTNIGNIHFSTNNFKKALDFYQGALKIDEELANKSGIANSMNNIGLVYFELNDYKNAMKYYQTALSTRKELDDKRGFTRTLLNISEVNRKNNLYSIALKNLETALQTARSIEDKAGMRDAYEMLFKIHEKQNNPRKALLYLKNYNRLDKEILNQRTRDKIVEMESAYTLDRKEKEIEILKKDKVIQSMTIKRQKTTQKIFIFGSLLLLGLIILLFRLYRIKTISNLQLQEAYKKLDETARHDPLTGLSNRRDMMEKIEYEKKRFLRHGNPFALVICDIDNFKAFNDNFGHDGGDFVLVKVAEHMKALIRKQDSIGRWGGEEFILLLPETTANGARTLAEKIRTAIPNQKYIYKNSEISITLTFGICIFHPDMQINDCLNTADAALYKGKTQGKNRVFVA